MENKVSVIVPTYNEAGGILQLIEAIHTALSHLEHEILIVDDNSPDGTYARVVENAECYVKPILRKTDRGFAKSIRCGLENATGDVIIIMDSDFNHQPKYLPFMVEATRYYDVVTASRFLFGGAMFPRSRHLLSWIFNVFVRVVTQGQITDNLYGFFAIRKPVLDRLNYDDIFWGFGDYSIRLLYFFQQMKLNILQFPVINGERISGEGNSSFIKVFWQYTVETLKLCVRKGRLHV